MRSLARRHDDGAAVLDDFVKLGRKPNQNKALSAV
jgi:hypothetical protein